MVSTIRSWLRSLVDIRRAEYAPVALMLGYGFLALTSYYVVKPARNSIFVDRVGADALPLVYVLTAVVVVGVMVVYSRYVERVGHLTLILSSMAGLGAATVGFWFLLRGGSSSVVASGGFYIFVKLYPLFLVSQFWLVANLLFTTTQARRLFGPIGMGLILGGIAGSSVAGFAGERLGTEALLLVATGVLGLCALLVLSLAPRIRKGSSGASARLTEDLSGSAVALLRDSTHLRTIAWILGLTIVVGTLLDWQLNRAVELFIEGEDAKTEFWGGFYAVLNVASVVIQLAFTSWVLRRFGVGLALFILPVFLGVASLGILALPVLGMVALGKGTEGALRYSLDQSTRELLFLPVPTDVKYKVKPLIDLAVYRGGTGVGGILLLIFVNQLGLSVRWISLVTLVAVGAWIWHAWRMRREFAESLRRLIGARDVRLEELLVQHLSAETRQELEAALECGEEEKVLYALSLLERVPSSTMIQPVRKLLDHPSQQVRGKAVALLTELEAEEAEQDVRALLRDSSLLVRAEAIRFVCEVSEDDPAQAMEAFLDAGDPEVEMGAVGCLVRHGDREQQEKGMERIRALATHDDVGHRRSAAVLLGQLAPLPEEGSELLSTLAWDEDVAVCRDAMEALGRAGDTSLVPLVLDRFRTPAYQPAAAAGLAAFGPAIHDELLDVLEDDEEALDIRVRIPGLLLPDADQAAVERLWRVLPEAPPSLRYRILKVLNKLRRNRDDLSFEELDPTAYVRDELGRAAWHLVAFEELRDDPADREEKDLLDTLLLQRYRESAERSVRALALQLSQSDLYAAFRAWESSQEVSRQRGFELMDALMPREHRSYVDPLLNPDAEPRTRVSTVASTFGLERSGPEETLDLLVRDGDYLVSILAHRRRGGSGFPDAVVPDELEARARADAPLEHTVEIPTDESKLMDVIERGEILRKAKIFRSLRVEELGALATLTDEIRVGPGEVVFEEGDPGGTLYVVAEGRVETRKGGRVLFTARRGRSVGSLRLLDGLPADYTAVALEDSLLLGLGREPFQTLLQERTQVVMSVLEYLTGVVRGLNEAPDSEDRSGEGGEAREATGATGGSEAGTG